MSGSNLMNLLNRVDEILISAANNESSTFSEANFDAAVSSNVTPMKNLVHEFNSPQPTGGGRFTSAGKIQSANDSAQRGYSQSFTGSLSSKKNFAERQSGLIHRQEVRGDLVMQSLTLDSKRAFGRKLNYQEQPSSGEKPKEAHLVEG